MIYPCFGKRSLGWYQRCLDLPPPNSAVALDKGEEILAPRAGKVLNLTVKEEGELLKFKGTPKSHPTSLAKLIRALSSGIPNKSRTRCAAFLTEMLTLPVFYLG